MHRAAAKRLLHSLIVEASNAKSARDVMAVRDRAEMLVQRALPSSKQGNARLNNIISTHLLTIYPRQRTLPFRLFRPNSSTRFLRSQVINALNTILFAIELTAEETDLPAAEPPLSSLARLQVMIEELVSEVEVAGLTVLDKERILAALVDVARILNSDTTATQKRHEFDDMVSEAVLRAARPGPASRLVDASLRGRHHRFRSLYFGNG
jgi:hypothetical protein